MKLEMYSDEEIQRLVEEIYYRCVPTSCQSCLNKNEVEQDVCKTEILQEIWRKWENAKEKLNAVENRPMSVLVWSKDFTQIHNLENYLVVFKDCTGDYDSYYTAVAWRTHEKACWINDNNPIFDEPVMWAKIPDGEKVIAEYK